MSRRHSAVKRVVLPDAKYNDQVVAKFINNVMEQGKNAAVKKREDTHKMAEANKAFSHYKF